MNTTMKQLWNDDFGAVVSAEIMLIATVLVIGVIVGLKSVRDSVVSELADVAQAMNVANQSFFFNGMNGMNGNQWGGGMMGNGMMGNGMMGGGMGGMGGGMGSMGCINVCAGAMGE